MARSLRPAGADDLGLRRALADRLLPLLVAAMLFLAALALAGAVAAAGLAAHWRGGAASMLTVQVPLPQNAAGAGTRADAVLHALQTDSAVAAARRLTEAEVSDLLKPWLGADAGALALRLPAVIEVRLAPKAAQGAVQGGGQGAVQGGADAAGLDARLTQAAPGTLVERNGTWLARLADLAASVQACAGLALVVVVCVAAAVVMLAARAGITARRDAIEIFHALGATDGMVAHRFAMRVFGLVLLGAILGFGAAVPVILSLARLARPFVAAPSVPADLFGSLPPQLWLGLAALPVFFAVIGWATAQATVRAWLGRLP